MSIPAVQSAGTQDRPRVISVITLAFSGDPLVRWLFPDPKRYLDLFPQLADAFGGNGLAHGATFITGGGTAAALWLPPGIEPDNERMSAVTAGNIERDISTEMAEVFGQMGACHPDEPHWYLPLIGVDPAHQGKGYGSVLMRHATERFDAEGVSAYLESTNPRNISLYLRHGFEIVRTIQAGSSPPVVPMIRHPR